MKKLCLLLLIILLPYFSPLSAQDTITVPKLPEPVKKINSFESAKNFLWQATDCLILGNITAPDRPHSCNKSNQLVISYALGFLLAARFPIKIIAESMKKKNSFSNTIARNAAQVLFESLAAAGLAGISTPLKLENLMVGGPAVHPLLSSIYQVLISTNFIYNDIQSMIENTIYDSEAKYKPIQFLKALGKYLVMNTKCIFAESYCSGQKEGTTSMFGPAILTTFARRKALYFWLGYLSGTIFRITPFKKIIGKVTPSFIPVPKDL